MFKDENTPELSTILGRFPTDFDERLSIELCESSRFDMCFSFYSICIIPDPAKEAERSEWGYSRVPAWRPLTLSNPC